MLTQLLINEIHRDYFETPKAEGNDIYMRWWQVSFFNVEEDMKKPEKIKSNTYDARNKEHREEQLLCCLRKIAKTMLEREPSP